MADEDLLTLLRAIGDVAWALAALTDDYWHQPNGDVPLLVLHHLDELARLRGELGAMANGPGAVSLTAQENAR